jgi:hypothetical protein
MPFLSSLPSGMISLLEWWTSELLHWVWKCEFGNDWFMYVHTSISYMLFEKKLKIKKKIKNLNFYTTFLRLCWNCS